jgi:hypothetical protein
MIAAIYARKRTDQNVTPLLLAGPLQRPLDCGTAFPA